MKKQSLFFVTVVFFLLTLANRAKASGATTDSSRATFFSYSGIKEDLVFFKVNYANPEGRNFTFEVRNDNGEILYSQMFNNKDFIRTVCIPGSKDKSMVNFSIRSGKTYYKQSFEVNPEIRLVDEYVITKL